MTLRRDAPPWRIELRVRWLLSKLRREQMTKPNREQVEWAARAEAREQGCVCDVEVTLEEVRPGVYYARVSHDDWCPLIRGREDRN